MTKALKILIADDETDIRKYVRHVLEHFFNEEQEITEAENGAEVVQLCQTNTFDLILLDVRMPEMSGLEALEEIQDTNGNAHTIVMTAHGNVQDAVLAIKSGAYDYIEKPLDQEVIRKIVQQALSAKEIVREISLSRPILESDTDSEIIGQSETMKNMFQLVKKFSHVSSTVLLRGENGTGKELVAKAIHLNSPRNSRPFVTVNCAAIPENLIESELFGHEKGAFTGADSRKIGKFQMANQGTLFLDEIAELKYELQAKLLRALQDQTFMPVGSNRVQKTDARIVAATNRNLEKMIIDGQFREDLYFRLNVMPIFIPPLRERKEDIPYLLEFFIEKYKQDEKKIRVASEAMETLTSYDWPGNIRQLENVVQRALLFTDKAVITPESLPEELIGFPKDDNSLDFEKFKNDSEKDFITKALLANKGKINRTVANANIPKNTLLRKIKKYEIDIKAMNKK